MLELRNFADCLHLKMFGLHCRISAAPQHQYRWKAATKDLDNL